MVERALLVRLYFDPREEEESEALLEELGELVSTLGIGVVGEYVARIHVESKRRPLWLVDYTVNLPDAAPDAPAESQERSVAA